eukprot:TRINITY_DN5751_c0_g1_i2.p1 TRINITY_DN5751_c0_g1~~TRINITY_DN5751_c0_g1_i2.p1  ORF type:complete len:576 (+),score=124.78 TRINITY_DN5751_c0_g1_i2:92-1729(+)
MEGVTSSDGEEEMVFEEDVPLMQQLDERDKTSRKHAKYILIVFSIFLLLFAVAAVIVTLLVVMDVIEDDNDDDGELWERITSDKLHSHLKKLQSIAMENDGSRAVRLGYNASLAYVQEQLEKHTDYELTVQHFSFQQTVALAPPELRIVDMGPRGDVVLVEVIDFSVLRDSGSADMQAPVYYVGLGCEDEDYENFPAGSIALTDRGTCPNLQRTDAARAANASAVLVANYATESEPTGGSVGGVVPIPVVGITNKAGQFLRATNPRPTVFVNVTNEVMTTNTMNLIADTQVGDENSVIVVGSHLDSVPVGPGINDDGSGTSTNLELAIQLFSMDLPIKNKIRFAWWSAEELGLKGSTYYVTDLLKNDPEAFDQIAMDLNFDMLGSPNYFRALMDGEMCPDEIRTQCVTIMNLFGSYFESQELVFTTTPLNNRSDHGPFLDAGKPVGGVKAGAEQIKTEEQRTLFGGYANTNLDPCYHQHCDSIDNVNMEILLQFARSAAYVLQRVAEASDLRGFLESGAQEMEFKFRAKRDYDPQEELRSRKFEL